MDEIRVLLKKAISFSPYSPKATRWAIIGSFFALLLALGRGGLRFASMRLAPRPQRPPSLYVIPSADIIVQLEQEDGTLRVTTASVRFRYTASPRQDQTEDNFGAYARTKIKSFYVGVDGGMPCTHSRKSWTNPTDPRTQTPVPDRPQTWNREARYGFLDEFSLAPSAGDQAAVPLEYIVCFRDESDVIEDLTIAVSPTNYNELLQAPESGDALLVDEIEEFTKPIPGPSQRRIPIQEWGTRYAVVAKWTHVVPGQSAVLRVRLKRL